MDKKGYITLVFCILVLTFIFFNKMVLHPNDSVTINADIMKMTSMWDKQIRPDVINNHELPLWNPDVYSGTPLISNPLSMLFYPINILFYLIPFQSAFIFYVILNVFLISLFSFMYFRLINLSKGAAILSTIIFTFSGIVVLWQGITSFINVLVWFPLLLYLAEKMIQTKKIRYSFLIGLVIGLQLLGGGPQIFLYSSFIFFMYVILRLLFDREKWLRILDFIVIAGVIGILIGAVQLFPTLQYSKYSVRDEGVDYNTATMHSLAPYALVNLMVPEAYGNDEIYWGFWQNSSFRESYIYVGVVTLILALIALIIAKKDKYIKIFGVIAIFAILFSLGKYTPFFSIFYHIPLFNVFRAPARMMVFFVFAMAFLGGVGLDSLTKLNRLKMKKVVNILAILFLLSVLVVSAVRIGEKNIINLGTSKVNQLYELNKDSSRVSKAGMGLEYYTALVPVVYNRLLTSLLIFVTFFGVILFSLFLWVNKKMTPEVLKTILFFVLIVDLFLFSAQFASPRGFEPQFKTTPIIDKITQDTSTFRVLSLRNATTKDNLPQYLAIYNKIQLASGCDAIFLKKYAEYSCLYGGCDVKPDACIQINDVKYPKMIDLLNIKYVISEKNLTDPSLNLTLTDNGVNLYENTDVLSRVFFVTGISGDKKDYELYNYRPLNVKLTPNTAVIDGDFDLNGIVVYSDTYYGGWNVYVDKKKAELLVINDIVKAVHVDKGHHIIEFKYEFMGGF